MTVTAREIPHIDAWTLLDDINTRDLEQREAMAWCFLHVCQQADRVCARLNHSNASEIEAAALLDTLRDLRTRLLDRDYLGIRAEMHAIEDRDSQYLVRADDGEP